LVSAFIESIDNIRVALLIQLPNLWAHASTAIEGNSLAFGETAFFREEGMAVSGKLLKDHEEVVGHAWAIDLIYKMVRSDSKSLTGLLNFALSLGWKPGLWKKPVKNNKYDMRKQLDFNITKPDE